MITRLVCSLLCFGLLGNVMAEEPAATKASPEPHSMPPAEFDSFIVVVARL